MPNDQLRLCFLRAGIESCLGARNNLFFSFNHLLNQPTTMKSVQVLHHKKRKKWLVGINNDHYANPNWTEIAPYPTRTDANGFADYLAHEMARGTEEGIVVIIHNSTGAVNRVYRLMPDETEIKLSTNDLLAGNI